MNLHDDVMPLLTLPRDVFNKVGFTDGADLWTDTALIALNFY
jgi:hypothetical protein